MSSLQDTVALYRKRLLAQEASAQLALEMHYASTLRTIQPRLDNLYRQIQDKQARGEAVPPSWLYEERRLKAIKQLVSGQVDQFGVLALAKTGEMQRLAVALGTESAQALLQATVPAGISWSFGVPSASAIASLIGATQAGSPLARLFSGFGLEAAKNVERSLITGLTLGWNPRQIAPLVERALGVPRWRALTIARTEMLRAYKDAALENYRANSDVCDKWIWHASLSPRTCASCIAMHGTEHPLSEDLNGHPCCRCARVPKTKSWDDILGPLGIDTSGIRDTRPAIRDGSEWFDKQDESTQRKILGSNAAYDLYSSGTSLSDFVGINHDKEWGTSVYQKPAKEVAK
jgi:SPP1 gp7 family putative phage head morphogenesis protein